MNYKYDKVREIVTILNSDKTTITKEDINNMILDLNKNNIILKAVILDKSFEKIEDHAFYNKNITGINFDDNSRLIYIGNYAFANNKIENLSLPSKIEHIDNFAFANNNIEQFINFSIFNTIKWGDNVFFNNDFNRLNKNFNQNDMIIIDKLYKNFNQNDMIIIDNFNKEKNNFNKDFNENVLYIINKINQERDTIKNDKIINNEQQIKEIFIYK